MSMSDLARTFAALSDETRLKMVEHLLTRDEAPAGELAALSDISAPAVSRHLKVLREAGLVRMEGRGTKRIYAARPEAFAAITDWAKKHRMFWGGSLERLDRMLTDDDYNDRE